MTSISDLSSLSRLTLPEPRAVGPSSGATAGKTSALPSYRTAGAGFSGFSAEISSVARTSGGLQEIFGGELEKIFGALNKRGDADAFLEEAFGSLKDLTQKALDDPSVTGVQIRIASVSQQFRSPDGERAVFSSVSQLSIEVGLVRDGKVAAEDVELLSFEGKKLSLTDEQKQTGIVSGLFTRDDESAENPPNKAQATAIEQALERLKLVNDALAAFRRGDIRPLQEVENLFRGGTLDAETVRALSKSKDVTGSQVFPGSGILDL
ncbi:hypothetical protein NUH88_14005 [Nisaea acidiphila]|uniref:Uncharacterized protein n=1 Tax=Nisaea acidiphila TaxID=1862145 RepID=A0A9J7ANK4_9PROT|nr:hypothetical protein [Nisaea acidiphila]UUX48522.1 hypothetical protein NUH88_14005 [Nisaea acidiphila]